MLTTVYGAKCIGIEAVPVAVEIDIASGIGIHLVGLADAAVKESLLRTVTAMQSMGYRIPGKKIVINLAPADMHKKGSGYDLPIAVGIIAASAQERLPLSGKFIIMGELGLDGTVRPVPGALPIAELASIKGFDGCILPFESAAEAAGYDLTELYGVKTLSDVIHILNDEDREQWSVKRGAPPAGQKVLPAGPDPAGNSTIQWPHGMQDTISSMKTGPDTGDDIMDFAEIVGQEGAKRGLEIAAAGGHNVIMVGPPGAGKSSLARAMVRILPPMDREEALQTSKIYSVAGKGRLGNGFSCRRPFRSPHYSTSVAALIGGGSDNILPGEISLAHNGVLFLDEFCEAPKRVTEALRAPVEEKRVTISRIPGQLHAHCRHKSLSMRLLRRWRPVYLLSCPQDGISVQAFRTDDGQDRHPSVAQAGKCQKHCKERMRRTEPGDSRKGQQSQIPADGKVLRRRHPYQFRNERASDKRILSAFSGMPGFPRKGSGADRHVRPGMQPHTENSKDDSRPSGRYGNRACPPL